MSLGDPITAILAIGVVGLVVYAAGVERSRDAAASAAGTATRAARSGTAAGLAGLGVGLQFGNDLLMAIMAEPFALTTALAGIMGALGIEGFLGDIGGLQFILIGFGVFLATYVVAGIGED
jgi:hypothetical protein